MPLLVDGFTHVFVFKHPGELLFGTALLYYFRIFERQYGSAKYGSYAVATLGISYVLQALLAVAFGRHAASGLYPLLFSNLVSFLLDVPALHKFAVLGFRMTDKVRRSWRGSPGALQLRRRASQPSWTASLRAAPAVHRRRLCTSLRCSCCCRRRTSRCWRGCVARSQVFCTGSTFWASAGLGCVAAKGLGRPVWPRRLLPGVLGVGPERADGRASWSRAARAGSLGPLVPCSCHHSSPTYSPGQLGECCRP